MITLASRAASCMLALALVLALSPVAFAQSAAPPAADEELVADIQTMLSELGYAPGPADGIMGERTRQAISRYQANAGLQIDGRASEALRRQLRASTGRVDRERSREAFQEEAATSEPRWQGETTAAAMLRQSPSNASGTVRGLPVGTRVEVLGSRGAWLEVRLAADRTRGWLRLDEVRGVPEAASTQAQPEKTGGFFSALSRGITRLIRGSSGTGSQGTVTIGVRGLTREELAGATRDAAQVERMEAFGASAGEARDFAAANGLEARTVGYPPERRARGSNDRGGGEPPASGAGTSR